MIVVCPVCEQEFVESEGRPAEFKLAAHLRLKKDEAHREYRETMPAPDDEFSTDEPPRPRATAAKKTAKKQAAPKPTAGGFTLAQQLELPYHLVGDLARTRMPQTAMALHMNAAVKLARHRATINRVKRFLMRYPSLRAKIETGMIGADVLALVMVHVEILRVAREEIAAQRAVLEHYEGGLETRPAA